MQTSFDKEKIKMIRKLIEAWKSFRGYKYMLDLEEKYRKITDCGYLFLQPLKNGEIDLCMIPAGGRFAYRIGNFSGKDYFCANLKDLFALKFKGLVGGYVDTKNKEIVFAEKSGKKIKLPLKKPKRTEKNTIPTIMELYEKKEVCEFEVENIDFRLLEALGKQNPTYFQKNQNGKIEIIQKESCGELNLKTEIPAKKGFIDFGIGTGEFITSFKDSCVEKVKFSILDGGEIKWISFNFDGINGITTAIPPLKMRNT